MSTPPKNPTAGKSRLRNPGTSIPHDLNTTSGVTLQTNLIPNGVACPVPIQVSRWARNGKHPNALLESMKGAALNSAAMFLAKEAYRSPGWTPWPSSWHGMAVSTHYCPRWRSAFHTGPFTWAIDLFALVQGDSSFAVPTAWGQCDLTNMVTNTTTSASFPIGNTLLSSGQAWDPTAYGHFVGPVRLEVTPDTDYTMFWSDNDGSQMVFGHAVEVASLAGFRGGAFAANIAAGGPIVSGYRQNAAEVVRALWQRSGWQLCNFSREDGVFLPIITPGTTSGRLVNIMETVVDQTTGATLLGGSVPLPSSPGYIIDTRGRARRSELKTGIPVTLAVYGISGGGDVGAYVLMTDANGNEIVLIEEGWGTSGNWAYATGFLPANAIQQYYFFMHQAGTTTFQFHAFSLYETPT